VILVTMLVIVITLKIEKPKEQCEKAKLKRSGPPKIAQKEGGSPLKRIKNILFF
jgi:hypothetical protein